MSIDSFCILTKTCWRMPTSHRFAAQVNIDASASAHDAYIGPNGYGIDDLKEYLRVMIGQIDESSVGENPQIPIACTLI